MGGVRSSLGAWRCVSNQRLVGLSSRNSDHGVLRLSHDNRHLFANYSNPSMLLLNSDPSPIPHSPFPFDSLAKARLFYVEANYKLFPEPIVEQNCQALINIFMNEPNILPSQTSNRWPFFKTINFSICKYAWTWLTL